jgi:hypothetical protein
MERDFSRSKVKGLSAIDLTDKNSYPSSPAIGGTGYFGIFAEILRISVAHLRKNGYK